MTTIHIELSPTSPGLYSARLADYTLVIESSRTPIYDAARALLAQGWAATTKLTARHQGALFDCWLPTEIGKLARWSVTEGERTPIKRVKWKAREFA